MIGVTGQVATLKFLRFCELFQLKLLEVSFIYRYCHVLGSAPRYSYQALLASAPPSSGKAALTSSQCLRASDPWQVASPLGLEVGAASRLLFSIQMRSEEEMQVL